MFYGWVIVAGVFMAQCFMVGFFTYGFPLLPEPVTAEFGVSASAVMMGVSISGPIGAVLAPFLGPLVDRWSARGMMIIGAVMLVAALLAMSYSTTILLFTTSFAVLMAGANTLLGPITGSTLVSRWFDATRGRALGIAATGTSIGGMVIPLLLGHWIATQGWRGSLRMLAASVAICVLPLLVIGLRDQPSDKGLLPDGASSPPTSATALAGDAAWTTSDVVRSRSYWLIGCSLGLLFMAYVGVLANLHLYATELGIEIPAATRLISVIAVMGFVGKLVFGWAADRISRRVGLWLAQALAAAGIAILSIEPAYGGMLVAVVLMGFAAGGMLPVWGAIVADCFGLASYGRVMGLMMPIIALFTSPGPLIASESLGRTGGYELAFRIFVGALGLAALLLVPLADPSEPSSDAEPGPGRDSETSLAT